MTNGSAAGAITTVAIMSTIMTVAPSAMSFSDVYVSLIRNGAPAQTLMIMSPAAWAGS